MVREFTVAVFVVQAERVLLHWHRKLRRWLPPGGHIEPGELPDEAAIRETREETGLEVELVDGWTYQGEAWAEARRERPRRLIQPLGIQLEDIAPGHQHIDLIYLARPRSGAPVEARAAADDPDSRPSWFSAAQWRALGITGEVDRWATAAVAALAAAGA